MWDLPGPGLEPVCPALTGGFLTTAPPGESLTPVSTAARVPWRGLQTAVPNPQLHSGGDGDPGIPSFNQKLVGFWL